MHASVASLNCSSHGRALSPAGCGAVPAAPQAARQQRQLRRPCTAPAPSAQLASRWHRSSAAPCRRPHRASSPPAAAAECEASAEDPATEFDWKLGLALAGCSFEAYNDIEWAPEDAAGHLCMASMGGTEVSFVDKEFLRSKFAGLLEVTVKSASGLPAADWWPGAKSDPYAVVSVGDSAAATAVVTQCLEPSWGETFYLFVSDPASQRLTVRVLDADVGKSDDLLGTSMRGLQDVVGGSTLEVDLPLRGTKGAAGSLSLSLRFLPFDDEVLAEEAAAPQMGSPVLGSPPSAIMRSEWRSLQRDVLNAAADAMFDPLAYVDNPETDTQAWLFWNPVTREVCVAFRGTEQAKWKDILTDLRLVPSSLDPEGVGEVEAWKRRSQPGSEGPSLEATVAALQGKRAELRASLASGLQSVFLQQEARRQEREQRVAAAAAAKASGSGGGGAAAQQGEGQEEEGEEPVWVHSGFLEAYVTVRPIILRLLDTLLAGETEPWTLYVTGHSLGGALSTLCAYDCARRAWRAAAHRPRLVHYSYGSPRVGNRAFADEFDRLVPNAWRVVNSNDAVTLVPRMLGYCHIGHKAELAAEGQVLLTRHSRRGLGEGAEMAGVALAAAVNLPMLTEQLLATKTEGSQGGSAPGQRGEEGSGDGTRVLVTAAASAAASMATAAASALADAAQQAATAAVESGDSGAAGAAAALGTTAADIQKLLEDEVRAMQGLLDGTGLNEHLEPLYLENLRAAVEKVGGIQKLTEEQQ